jgi:hypothetical protein
MTSIKIAVAPIPSNTIMLTDDGGAPPAAINLSISALAAFA